MVFEGFPAKVLCTPFPDPILNALLETITDMAELKVVLRAIFLLNRQRSFPPAIPVEMLLSDGVLNRGLEGYGDNIQSDILKGLNLAVDRNIFQLFKIKGSGIEGNQFLLNTDSARRWLSNNKDVIVLSSLPQDIDVNQKRAYSNQPKSNIFALYEDNIGTISPMLAEELKLAEKEYNHGWIEEAFQIAVNQNKRSWGYISAILRRWSTEGRDDRGEYGKSRGYTQEDNPGKYIEEYQRRRGRLPWEQSDKQGK